MKKKCTIALLMIMALVCIFALASCDGNGENPNKFNPTQMEKLGDAFRKLESKNYAVDSTLYYVEKDGSLTKRSFAVYRFAGDDFSFFYDGSTDKSSHIIDEFYEFNEDTGWYYRYSYKKDIGYKKTPINDLTYESYADAVYMNSDQLIVTDKYTPSVTTGGKIVYNLKREFLNASILDVTVSLNDDGTISMTRRKTIGDNTFYYEAKLYDFDMVEIVFPEYQNFTNLDEFLPRYKNGNFSFNLTTKINKQTVFNTVVKTCRDEFSQRYEISYGIEKPFYLEYLTESEIWYNYTWNENYVYTKRETETGYYDLINSIAEFNFILEFMNADMFEFRSDSPSTLYLKDEYADKYTDMGIKTVYWEISSSRDEKAQLSINVNNNEFSGVIEIVFYDVGNTQVNIPEVND